MSGLAIFAIIIGVIGFFFLSNATTGTGIICFGCLLAIIARMNQADKHHAETTQVLNSINRKVYELPSPSDKE